MAGSVVETALQEADRNAVEASTVVTAAATGAVEAAYQVDQTHGDSVRQSVLKRVLEPRLAVAADLEQRLSEIAEQLSSELPRGRVAWRGAAMIRAWHLLFRAGGIDLAASLAYFTVLSFFPLVALAIMGVAIFGDPEEVSKKLAETLAYYFPGSGDLIRQAVESLLVGSLAVGLLALVSMVYGANGLFMSANRSVNRIYRLSPRRYVQTTVAHVAIATFVAILFLLSLGLTAFF